MVWNWREASRKLRRSNESSVNLLGRKYWLEKKETSLNKLMSTIEGILKYFGVSAQH